MLFYLRQGLGQQPLIKHVTVSIVKYRNVCHSTWNT